VSRRACSEAHHREKPIRSRSETPIEVRLVDPVGSARNRSGDTFQATLEEPLERDGAVVVPRGANVTGRVVAARPSGHLETPAELSVTLSSLESGEDLPDCDFYR